MADQPTIDMSTEDDAPDGVDIWFTFGVQYGPDKERHPVVPELDGSKHYVRITAPNHEAARALAFAIFGRQWAFDYTDAPDAKHGMSEYAHITLGMHIWGPTERVYIDAKDIPGGYAKGGVVSNEGAARIVENISSQAGLATIQQGAGSILLSVDPANAEGPAIIARSRRVDLA